MIVRAFFDDQAKLVELVGHFGHIIEGGEVAATPEEEDAIVVFMETLRDGYTP